MIALSQSLKYNLNSNDKLLGTLLVSKFIKSIDRYKMPFEDTSKKELVKIGNGSYDNFDNFVISSLNDYYSKLSSPSDVETKEDMLEKYTELYELWSSICDNKKENNVEELNKLYNKISYGLFLLGYDDNQL
ncbi:MAG: hypothetical protein E7158_05020 [Firmicutes bacterium]|nr:hypothetical protein [Bacillota bacterium]